MLGSLRNGFGVQCRDTGEEVIRIQSGVKSEEANLAVRVQSPDFLRHLHPEPQGRVHGNGDPDETSPADFFFVEGLDGQVQDGRSESGTVEKGLGPADTQGRTSELVAGDE